MLWVVEVSSFEFVTLIGFVSLFRLPIYTPYSFFTVSYSLSF